MKYKEDWEKTKERYMAWWEGEILDRPCVMVCGRKEKETGRQYRTPKNLQEQWLDLDLIMDNLQTGLENTFFGGEAFPSYYPNLGPDLFSTFLGGDLEFAESTSWVFPTIKDWEKDSPLKFAFNKWWDYILKFTKTARDRFGEDLIVGFTDVHANLDTLSTLRNPGRLCMDLVEYPEYVKAQADVIFDGYKKMIDDSYAMFEGDKYGSTTWLTAWAPGRYCSSQCDFICMISPKMGWDFVYEPLKKEIEYLDYSVYHLDGPDAAKNHLDMILSIEKLRGIQWVPGAGREEIAQWIPLLKKIQAGKKNIHVYVNQGEIDLLMKELSPKGLMIVTWASTEQEAKDVIKKVSNWKGSSE